MLAAKKVALSGWGKVIQAVCNSYRPEKPSHLQHIIQESKASLIARGCGMSYGDASFGPDGVVLSERLNRFLGFDPVKGVINVQAGVTLAEILDIILPQGWIVPVIPGTKHVSAGGAFACDVHGKNHFKDGCFANHVSSIILRLANSEVVSCSRDEHSDIFWATAGGLGLTGFIESLTLQLKPIKSLSLKTTTHKVANIESMIEAFERAKEQADYMVGWIDHFASGSQLGKGIFEQANHITEEEGGTMLASYTPPKQGIAIPPIFPSFTLNKYTMALYNKWRFARYSDQPKTEIQAFEGFFHPLDGLRNWNNLYGKAGFFQYQCMIPQGANTLENLKKLLSMIQDSGQFSYLAVLKYHGEHKGMLSFPIAGYSLALDFPNNPKVHHLLRELDQFIAAIGGCVYLAKDATLSSENFHHMYKEQLTSWRHVIDRLDPQGKFQSSLSQRLDLRGGADAT